MTRDLRPLMARNDTNGISRAESYRDLIERWFAELVEADDVRCELTASAPGNGVVFVVVETWLALGTEGATRRTRVEIEIVPRDFCRWPVEFDVVLLEPGRARAWPGVVEFSRENAQALWRYMTGQAAAPAFGFKRCRTRGHVRGIAESALPSYPAAGPARTRALLAGSFAFLRERNRPRSLLPDVDGALPWLLLLFAFLTFFWPKFWRQGLLPGGYYAHPFLASFGFTFFTLVLIEAIVVALVLWKLKISPARAWTVLGGTGQVASAGAAPATAVDNVKRDTSGLVAVGSMAALSLLSSLVPYAEWALVIVAALLWFRNRRRTRVVLSGGAPAARPRNLALIDSWQVLLIGLAGEHRRAHDEIVKALVASPDAEWSVNDETIWHFGVNGKEERRQTVVAYRSALAFLHIYPYGDDLYVGWDAHVNRGRWVEERVGRGIHVETGLLSEAHSIASGRIGINEYDVYDGNFVVERVHAVVTRFLRRLVDEHKLEQEIDFKIVRQGRGAGMREGGDAGAGATTRPLLSRLALRRSA